MWLTLLLAAFDDAANRASRKASRHEMEKRLFAIDRNRGPSITESLLRAFAGIVAINSGPEFESHRGSARQYRLQQMHEICKAAIGSRVASSLRFTPLPEFLFPFLAAEEPRLSEHRTPLVPLNDADGVSASVGNQSPFIPRVRTEFDPLLAIALQLWEDHRFRAFEWSFCTNIASAHDWIAATHADVRGWTWNQVFEASQAWHAKFTSSLAGLPVPASLVILRWPDGWTLQRLTEKSDLAREGESMEHCIGGPDRGRGRRDGESSYWQNIRDDSSVILSLRDEANTPEATIESSNLRVQQIQGPGDQRPREEVLLRLREAFWRLEAWPEHRTISRLGPSGVWTPFRIMENEEAKHALRNLNLAAADIGGDSTQKSRAPIGWHRRDIIHSALYSLGAMAELMGEPNNVRITREWLEKIQLPPDVEFERVIGALWSKTADEILLVVEQDAKPVFYYLETPNWENPTSTSSMIEALYDFTSAKREPPDVSHIEVFPGLPPGHLGIWMEVHESVAKAREKRAIQVLPVQKEG